MGGLGVHLLQMTHQQNQQESRQDKGLLLEEKQNHFAAARPACAEA